jgi:hypothetical protein
MLSMSIGYATIVHWSLTLLFVLIAIVFRKIKVAKWTFGVLAVVMGIIPILFLTAYPMMELQGRRKFVGQFYNSQTGGWINLHDDSTWTSNSQVFQCTEGIWKFVASEDFIFIEMSSSCGHNGDRLRIPAEDSKSLVFDPVQTSSFAGNELIFLRK